ncbi:HAD domain-containing protein [Streptomyces spongiae]|uniref:Uncharacterized protein n=1 Tax=Streptomyces spongiae TaxID=565072 RepID=A0A5N8XAK8_9ACTN|nr:hypothetical protein [Streptomyces spongiae]MPY56540.1 hypothetical protein [Streptomyces spongiae]
MQQAGARAANRPVLGLDVDGVVVLTEPFATAVTEHRVSAWGRWGRIVSVPATAPAIIGRLARDFEIVWVSAWGHNAHTALREALGLPDVPWRFLPVQFGKARAVAAYAGDRPWALVHDGLDDEPSESGTVVRVDPRRGLDQVDAEKLVEAVHGLPYREIHRRGSRP